MQEIRLQGSLRSFLESLQKTFFFFHPKSLSKVSRKRFHVFFLNAPIFRAWKWARNFNSDNSWVLSEKSWKLSRDFSAGKISACEHALTD